MIIKGDIELYDCTNLKSLGKLKRVNGNIYLDGCINFIDFGDLEKINGNLDLRNCKNIKSLGKLKTITGRLNLSGSSNLKLNNIIKIKKIIGLDLSNIDLRKIKNIKWKNTLIRSIEDWLTETFYMWITNVSITKTKLKYIHPIDIDEGFCQIEFNYIDYIVEAKLFKSLEDLNSNIFTHSYIIPILSLSELQNFKDLNVTWIYKKYLIKKNIIN